MKNGTRWPPSYSLPFLPRMPALSTRSPADEPLSVVKMKIAPCRFSDWEEGMRGRELYDHREDPQKLVNLADDPSHAATVQ